MRSVLRATGHTGLLAFCCLLAPAVAAPPRATPPAPEAGEPLRVLAYNIHHGEGMDQRLDLPRIAALIEAQQPDLVALQEVDRHAERTLGIDQATRLGELTGMASVFGDFMDYQGGQYGMALLSRWPIIEWTNHRLPDGAEPRSALAARVRSPHTGEEVVFVGIHLYRTEAERMAQAQAVATLYGAEATPVILAGDFNSTPGSAVLELLAKRWQIPAKGPDHLTYPATAPAREIDFVMVRPNDRLRVVRQTLLEEPVASDHRPLLAELRLRPAAASVDRVAGAVFADSNANGTRDPGEPGIAGVVVSDQISVAVTDSNGRYSLHTDGYGLVFVSLPAGYRPYSRFYQRLANEPVPHAIDFPLVPAPAPTTFRFMHASDPHVAPDNIARVRRVAGLSRELDVDFVLVTGDLVRDALRVGEDEARSYYDLYASVLEEFTAPVWNVPGNHEIFGIERHLSLVSPDHPLYGKEMYRHYFGPNYYSFNYGGVHFIGLDTVDIADLWYHGHVDSAQMQWLEADLATLAPQTPVVTFNHIPFFSAVTMIWGYGEDPPAPTLIKIDGTNQFRHVVSNARAVIELLHQHDFEIALGGHNHVREQLVYETEGGPMRFYLTAAVRGPSGVPELPFASGVTLYQVRDGVIDDGEFIRIDPLPDSRP